MAEHWIELVKLFDAVLDFIHADADFLREVELLLLGVGQELVEWWIQQADGGGHALEGGEDAGEVGALVGKEFGESGLAVAQFRGEDHFAHGVDAIAFEEHVFGPGQADAGGAEGEGDARLFWGVGIGADREAGCFGAPVHEQFEVFELLCFLGGGE